MKLPLTLAKEGIQTGFETKEQVAGWLAIAIVTAMVFMALTYTFLPASATARHYLTTAPMFGFVFMSVRNIYGIRIYCLC